MLDQLLDVKTRVPARRPGAVARPRLVERFARAGEARLTLVSAPAGFGKTTLLTAALAGTPSLAWLSVDPQDDEPARFWTYVLAALRTVAAGVGEDALDRLRSARPSTDGALTSLLNDLQALPLRLTLVLDDYHAVASREVHDGMAFLVEHLPPNVHLVVATRADPPLPLARLRARGELVEIRSADLRFTGDEAAAYLTGSMGLALADADVATLTERTEGWAAALQLAGLSLRGRDDPGAAVARFAGDDRFILDYLADEVMARLPADVRDFLLRTSVLARLTGPLCDAVTGRSGGAARLVELDRANLFLVPLDERRRWYRYHHLFADVLRAQLQEQHPDQAAELHRRAADWLGAHGEPTEAIRHALAGNDPGRAANLMELAVPLMRRERREAELRTWIRALPDDVVRARPMLGLALVGALAQVSDFAEVGTRLDGIEATLRPDGGAWPPRPPDGLVVVDERGFRSAPASVEMYRAALALGRGDLDATVIHAREALSLAPPDDDLIRAGAGALAGLAAWTAGDIATAHAAYTEAVAGLSGAGFLADALGCSITVGDLWLVRGRLGEARRTFQAGLDLAAGAPLRGTSDMHVGLAGVLLEYGDPAAAAGHLAAAERLGEHRGLPQNPYRSRVLRARLRETEGDLDAALVLIEDAERLYQGDYSPDVRPVAATRARLHLRRGEPARAEEWARTNGLDAGDELHYLREYEHVTLARLLLARHDGPLATGLLERLLAAAEAGGRHGTAIEVLALLALAHRARGDAPAALAALDRAVTLARPEGYVRIFADEGAPMAALLRDLARQAPDAAYPRRLVAAASAPARAVPTGGLVEPLSARELDVLRLLASDLDGPAIARELHVSLNTMRTHTRSIFRKLEVTSRRAAVRRAADLDLLARRGPA
ncbi:LuxR C-terminal-related transcriptional regulator [Pseudonocardia sp.]|uniref:LuxR C-terminal-related transcriptional regulator n=1 Tax=Pseudonocardia sp. TaxID=60912 RepID=UPI003D130CCC